MGPREDGIIVGGAPGDIVEGNEIGTDATGTLDLGNAGHGVYIGYQSALDQIGGSVKGAANVIAITRTNLYYI